MRAIDSALQLARNNNRKLKIIWEMSSELNCPFSDLFDKPNDFEIYQYSLNSFRRRIRDHSGKLLRKVGIKIPFGYDLYLFNDDILALKRKGADLNKLISSTKSVYIHTVHHFFDSDFKDFKPEAKLLQIINSFVKGYGEYTVGVHVRRKDNQMSIRYSPLEGFIRQMKEEVDHTPEVTFFLATDSSDVENELREVFKERIITRTKELDRNTAHGISDALIDLYCLANTRKIIGSYYSSFSETAAQIGNIKLIQVFNG